MSAQPPQSLYDLFVSYAPDDRAWVEGYLLDALRSAGVTVICEADFELGAARLAEFERAVQQSQRTLLVLSPAAITESFTDFVAILVQTYGLESGAWPVVPLLLKEVKLPPRLAVLVPLRATEPALWPEAVARLAAALQKPPPAPAARPACPYPGMRAFREADAAHFYGRAAEVEELLQRLRRHPFLALIGASGSGKSSLVYAGLLPALRRSGLFGPGGWLVRDCRPGSRPLAALRGCLAAADLAQFDPAAALAAEPGAARLLLVVDQFEEVFAAPPAERDAFFAFLGRFAALPGCYTVITVRSDFFFQDLVPSALWPLVAQRHMVIAPLGEHALREAIVTPAEDVGVYIESALVERLVAGSAGQPGLLPFVQEVLVRLWEKLERRYLPLAAYEALVLPLSGYTGQARTGIQAAMALLADEMIRGLGPAQQRIAQRIFLRLVQFGEGRDHTRRQQPVAALTAAGEDAGQFTATLAYLVENRLLVLSGEAGGEPRVDLAHEAMLTGWPLLGQWIQTYQPAELTRRRLEAAAEAWVRMGRGEGGLLDRVELREAAAWLRPAESPAGGPSADLLALIAASRRRARGRARVRGFLRALLVLAALALLSAGISAAVSWSLNRRWQAAPGAPASAEANALAGNRHGVVLGSLNYGVTWPTGPATWIGWQRAGLPEGNPVPGRQDPLANLQAINAIALDERRPASRYVFIDGKGVYKFVAERAEWVASLAPRVSDACETGNPCQVLAAAGDVVAYIANEPGVYLSQDGGDTWTRHVPGPAAPPGTLFAVAFDAQDRLLAGDAAGLLRGSGAPPYTWERLFAGGQAVLVMPHPAGGALLFFESAAGRQGVCLDDQGAPLGPAWPLPTTSWLLVGNVFPARVTGAAADLRIGQHYYFATTHGAVYETDCAGPARRIGQHSVFSGGGRLATTMEAGKQVLYWADWTHFQRTVLTPK